MTEKTKNKYNHYNKNFRREAVRRSEQDGVSAVDVANELDIHPNQIYNWRNQYKRYRRNNLILMMVSIIQTRK